MAIAWVLRGGRVTSALIGASRPEQVVDCVAALEKPGLHRRGAGADRPACQRGRHQHLGGFGRALNHFRVSSDRENSLAICFDAFSSREPASTSLENALAHRPEKWLRFSEKPMRNRELDHRAGYIRFDDLAVAADHAWLVARRCRAIRPLAAYDVHRPETELIDGIDRDLHFGGSLSMAARGFCARPGSRTDRRV